jgi:hypothetical protein
VLTPFSVAYTTSISGRQRAFIEFLRMTRIAYRRSLLDSNVIAWPRVARWHVR